MKFLLTTFAVALTPVAAAAPDKCTPGQLEKVVTILSTSSKDHVRDCQAASGGFSIFPPAAKSPTDDQVKHMCASHACLELISDVLDSGLVDCTLEWNGKSLNPHEMASSFQGLCDQMNRGSGSHSVNSTHIRLRRVSDASSASSAVEVGVIETYRPNRAHAEQYTPPLPCTEDAHSDASPEGSSHATPAATDLLESEWSHSRYATPVPTYVKHETYQPEGPHHHDHAPSAPSYECTKSSKPQPELYLTPTVVDSPNDQYAAPTPAYDPPVPQKPQWAHGVTHKPGDNWYQRNVRETSDDEQEGTDSDYASPTNEDSDSKYELMGDTDYEPDQYAADDNAKDSDYATVGKR